jgi:hypothetical protein
MTNTPDGTTWDAVPTRYRDTTFRSRLEADWAATLDSNGIVWLYEPEVITLPSGTVYIPDFWLPELGTWLEVKGPGIPRIEKTIELAKTRTCHCEDTCTCQWPGGELVLVGRTSLATKPSQIRHRSRCGYANWETPFGPTAFHINCPNCEHAQWITLRRPWRCRVCRHFLERESVYRPVDRKVRFAEQVLYLGLLFAMPDLGEPFTARDYAPLGESDGAKDDLQ